MREDEASPVRWMRSNRCHANNACVEVALTCDSRVAVRDAAHPDPGWVLVFTPAQWRSFTAMLRADTR
jgi:hypothetical protein